jgi:signal transduction histidine kinase
VNARLDHEWLLLEVKDNGPGIPRDVLERVQRAAVVFTPTPTRDGLGIGLEIIRRIAEAHSGSFELRSREGGGTQATLKIPITMKGENNETQDSCGRR